MRLPRRQSHERTSASSTLTEFQNLALSVDGVEDDFESLIEPLWPELMDAAAIAQVERIRYDGNVSNVLTSDALWCLLESFVSLGPCHYAYV